MSKSSTASASNPPAPIDKAFLKCLSPVFGGLIHFPVPRDQSEESVKFHLQELARTCLHSNPPFSLDSERLKLFRAVGNAVMSSTDVAKNPYFKHLQHFGAYGCSLLAIADDDDGGCGLDGPGLHLILIALDDWEMNVLLQKEKEVWYAQVRA